jgi:hypothetical protein
MKTKTALLFVLPLYPWTALAQGPLVPPGPPGPIMKSLAEVEPRTVIMALPYTISEAGSYVVGANLIAPTGSTTGITINSRNVTLDLNGFTLSGELSSGTAIRAGIAVSQVTVKNGHIEGWSVDGVNLDTALNSSVERLSVRAVSQRGIAIGFYSTVSDCRVEETGGIGYQLADDCVIKDCLAAQNTGSGIVLGGMGTASNCAVRGSGRHGIEAGTRSTVSGCRALSSAQTGIHAEAYVRVEKCYTSLNGVTGISLGGHCTVNDCAIADHREPTFSFTNQTVGRAGISLRGNGVRAGGNIISRCQLTGNDYAFESLTGGSGICTSNQVVVTLAHSAITIVSPFPSYPPVNLGTGAYGVFIKLDFSDTQTDGVNYFIREN